MDERLEIFLEQERPAANVTTNFLKYLGDGNMQDGVRKVYCCGEYQGEIKGTIIGAIAMGVIIGGGYLCKKAIANGINTAKAYRKEKKKINAAELKAQVDVTEGTDALEENSIS